MPQTLIKSSNTNRDDSLCYHGDHLVSGSLEALIRHLLPTAEYYPHRTYIFTFLLSARLFLQPHQLLRRLTVTSTHQNPAAAKLLRLLLEWTQTFPRDFKDQSMMDSLKKLCDQLLFTDKSHRAMRGMSGGAVLQGLRRRLSVLREYEQVLGHIPAAAVERLIPHRHPPPELSRSTPSTWAQQLTLIELERLSYVGAEEFVHTFMSNGPGDSRENRACVRTKTPFLDAYVDWFNRLSSLVTTEICQSEKKKQRAQMLDFFIDVAQECLNIGNFNSVMAVMSGMTVAPVSRLRKTWSKVNTDKFHILERLMDPSSNFINYRTALRGAAQRSLTAHSSHEKVVIPFFSLLLKDIYFLNEGCATKLPNGHINFQKCWELAKRVSEVMSWRRVECPFEKERWILQYVLTAPIGSSDALCLASFLREAPENNIDKQQWKSLRSSLRKPP